MKPRASRNDSGWPRQVRERLFRRSGGWQPERASEAGSLNLDWTERAIQLSSTALTYDILAMTVVILVTGRIGQRLPPVGAAGRRP